MERFQSKTVKLIVTLLYICACVSMFEVTFEKTELFNVNKKYYNYYLHTLKRANRKSPYILGVYQDLRYPLGNNLTWRWKLYEIISGREILTPVQFELRTCDAFKSEQYIGHMFSRSFPKGWVCPFPPGTHNWTNIVLSFTNWPYLPFTYSSLYVRTLTTIDGYINNELAHQARAYAVIKQKIQDEPSKKINIKAKFNQGYK